MLWLYARGESCITLGFSNLSWLYPMQHKLSHDETNSKVTVEFETVTIDTSVYLPHLLSSFLSKGGRIVRARVGHISQVAQGSYTSKPGKPPCRHEYV